MTPPPALEARRRLGSAGLVGMLLLLTTLAAYSPALRGGLLWDDDFHVTRPELQPVHGLERIWFEMGATAQYYPVLHTAFWVEHRLWGDATLGYHLVNVLLHAFSAGLFILILRRLAIPGAVLAGFIFALHPVAVESVAWISEQKNTLSTACYLVAALAYLRFDRDRRPAWYLAALGCFLLALLSKSVTATLPAALLVVFWWQRGWLSWRRDVAPLLPWFVLAAAAGLFTAWVERRYIGAHGAAFALSFGERCLLAGRISWFYLGKLLWPANLVFIYPRWMVSAGEAWQYLFPLALVGLFLGLWRLREWSRAPLAAGLLFVGTLFPALGFFNVYPFIFSFVADHFQYLASLGIIALAASAAARRQGAAGRVAALGLLAVLGLLTWRQSRIYRDAATLYRATIERNPGCWMAYTNLGTLLMEAGQPQASLGYFDRALQLKSDSAEEHVDRGDALRALGRPSEAIDDYAAALRLRPRYPEALYNEGVILAALGRREEAIAAYRAAVELRPGYAEAHNNLGNVLREDGRVPEAIAEGRRALELAPGSAVVRNNLGIELMAANRLPEARAQLEQAVRLRPNYPEAQNNLGNVMRALGDASAQSHYEEAIRLNPRFAEALYNLAVLQAAEGRMPEAINRLEEVLRIRPDYPAAQNNLGNALRAVGRYPEAEARYREELRLHPDDRQVHYNLSLLLHELGRENEAQEQLRLARPAIRDFPDRF